MRRRFASILAIAVVATVDWQSLVPGTMTAQSTVTSEDIEEPLTASLPLRSRCSNVYRCRV